MSAGNAVEDEHDVESPLSDGVWRLMGYLDYLNNWADMDYRTFTQTQAHEYPPLARRAAVESIKKFRGAQVLWEVAVIPREWQAPKLVTATRDYAKLRTQMGDMCPSRAFVDGILYPWGNTTSPGAHAVRAPAVHAGTPEVTTAITVATSATVSGQAADVATTPESDMAPNLAAHPTTAADPAQPKKRYYNV